MQVLMSRKCGLLALVVCTALLTACAGASTPPAGKSTQNNSGLDHGRPACTKPTTETEPVANRLSNDADDAQRRSRLGGYTNISTPPDKDAAQLLVRRVAESYGRRQRGEYADLYVEHNRDMRAMVLFTGRLDHHKSQLIRLLKELPQTNSRQRRLNRMAIAQLEVGYARYSRSYLTKIVRRLLADRVALDNMEIVIDSYDVDELLNRVTVDTPIGNVVERSGATTQELLNACYGPGIVVGKETGGGPL